MSKAEQNLLLLFDLHDKLTYVLFRSNSFQHSNHSLICATMFWSIKRSSCHCNSCIDIYSWTWNMSDKWSRAVHLVLRMQNKQNLQSFHQFWMRFIILFIKVIEHVHKIFYITKALSWEVILSSCPVPIRICSNSWNKTKQSINLFISCMNIFIDLLSIQGWICLWL